MLHVALIYTVLECTDNCNSHTEAESSERQEDPSLPDVECRTSTLSKCRIPWDQFVGWMDMFQQVSHINFSNLLKTLPTKLYVGQ